MSCRWSAAAGFTIFAKCRAVGQGQPCGSSQVGRCPGRLPGPLQRLDDHGLTLVAVFVVFVVCLAAFVERLGSRTELCRHGLLASVGSTASRRASESGVGQSVRLLLRVCELLLRYGRWTSPVRGQLTAGVERPRRDIAVEGGPPRRRRVRSRRCSPCSGRAERVRSRVRAVF